MSDAPASTSSAPVTTTTETSGSSDEIPVVSKDTAQPHDTTQPQPKRFKLKVDGKEKEYDESEVLRMASMAGGAQKKFEEAAKYRKQAETFISRLKTDPKSVLLDPNLGINFREIAEEYLYNQLQEDRLSPEQKRQKEMEEELKKYRDRDEQDKRKKQQDEEAKLEQHYTEHYDRIITDGLSKSGLPRTPATIRSVAKYLNMAADAGYDATVEEVIPFVKQDYLNTIQELFGASDGDTLLSLLGANADKIRKADLARLRGKQSEQPKPQIKQELAPSRDEKPQYIDKYQAAENIRRKLGLK